MDKIVFFSRGDNKFILSVLDKLSEQFEVKLITVSSTQDFKLIDQWMAWADISWFEWCDDLIIYGSKLEMASHKKIICRLHSYEAFTNYPSRVNWNNVAKLIFVSENIQEYVVANYAIARDITVVIPNGVDLDKINYRQRTPGFNVAYAGYINYKKGPLLLLQTFKEIYDADGRYRFYIAGIYQDPRYFLYFKQMVRELGLENNFFFEGWQTDIDKWLEDKDYIICSSVLESQNMSVMQAMAKGIKPVIHNFSGAKGIYPAKYIWNTVREAAAMVTDGNYCSEEYRSFIRDNYSIKKQIEEITGLISLLPERGGGPEEVIRQEKKNQDYFQYVKSRMNEFIPYTVKDFDSFDFDNAGIVLGKRERAVDGREMLEFILQDKENNKLIINNIWNVKADNELILPEQMKNSSNTGKIVSLCREILNFDVQFQNNLGGFVLDPAIKEDISKNYLAYMWERGIPASQFLPIHVYMKIVERYIFAASFLDTNSDVLEAPCGFGYGAAYISKKCKQVEALDLADDNITFSKQAYRHSNISWRTGDVTALPYDDSTFDEYISFGVFEHLPVATAIRHIEEAYRVLRKSGRFVISTPNREMRKEVHNPFHTKEYDFNEFNDILTRVFDDVELYSMVGTSIERGRRENAYVMLAVCKK